MERDVFAWSLSGEFLGTLPLSAFAAVHDIEPGQLLTELLRAQATPGCAPKYLLLAAGSGEMLLTLTRLCVS